MFAIAVFLEVTNQNLLLGVIPESLGLLLFGVGLIALTASLRRILSRVEGVKDEKRVKH
ncbi:MAG TPA: hypothetical protein VGC76_06645 [Pyrinomonadaceae bacterium]|jgi:hypothetical protein